MVKKYYVEKYKDFALFANMINLDGKIFYTVSNSPGGEVNSDTIFYYSQNAEIVSAIYSGGGIKAGHLIAVFNEDGLLNMHYHHINDKNEIKTGKCISIPEVLPNGKLRLHEKWQWTCDDFSKGESVIEER